MGPWGPRSLSGGELPRMSGMDPGVLTQDGLLSFSMPDWLLSEGVIIFTF